MQYKTIISFLLLTFIMESCQTKSAIVTSKFQAEQLGIYQTPSKKSTVNTPKISEIISSPFTSIFSKISDTNEPDYWLHSENVSYLIDQLINRGITFLGTPYRTGGTSTTGMDCSGFIIATFSGFSLKLPRTSNEMSRTGLEIPTDTAKKGDLIFFKTNGRSVINHVGMILEVLDNEIKFIHSSTQRGVIVSSTKEGYYKNTLAKINRVIN